eukprot:PITA_28360
MVFSSSAPCYSCTQFCDSLQRKLILGSFTEGLVKPQPVCYLNGNAFIFRRCNGFQIRSRFQRLKPMSSTDMRAHNHTILVTTGQLEPLDLTEENVNQVLIDARSELMQLFDSSVGISGVVELAEVDGPFVKLRLKGRFWHERSLVLARIGAYLQKRIPEILEVDIEDEAQLDDSPENF